MKMRPDIEAERLALQARLDAKKSQGERNRLGQFATPSGLAQDILDHAAFHLPSGKIRFLDPAIGTGAFYSALRNAFPESRIEEARGYEIDAHYSEPSRKLWQDTTLDYQLLDFTRQQGEPRFNLIICNPPYVRHHHVPAKDKARLQLDVFKACDTRIGGLAGLYCYFLGLAHPWLAKDGIAGWLIPSEFMDVNYGQGLKRYLLEKVTLLRIHRFDPNDVQFADALVSSAIVWFRNSPRPRDHVVEFTFGGTMRDPKVKKTIPARVLASEPKWTRFPIKDIRDRSGVLTVGDYFKIKRGLATGDNSYFILTAEQIAERNLPLECFRPILPSPRYVSVDEIAADEKGDPVLERKLYLLDTDLPEEEIGVRYPKLWAYLQEGRAKGLHERYLCRHRAPWYVQENRPPAPIVCTYLGRADKKNGRPFRFILNSSSATVANVYLMMYPTPLLMHVMERQPTVIRTIWNTLNKIPPDELLGEGRVYGGGLHKLEPKELANVPLAGLEAIIPIDQEPNGDLFLRAAS